MMEIGIKSSKRGEESVSRRPKDHISRLDQLLDSREEWTNIQVIIQRTIKQQSEIMRQQ